MKRLLVTLALLAGCTIKVQTPATPDAGAVHYGRFQTADNGGTYYVFDEAFGRTDGQDIAYDTSTGTNRSTALSQGRYFVYCTTDCWVKAGTTTVSNTTKDSSHATFAAAGRTCSSRSPRATRRRRTRWR